SETLFNFITNFQDEVHNRDIEYHRKVRDKEMTKSRLDYIEGIGEKKRTLLLKKFGSVKKIKEASIEEISEIKGINVDLAKKIKEELENS
ncbi:MAG: excinuclease ABC subunit C, partial [Clostridia bacterium]